MESSGNTWPIGAGMMQFIREKHDAEHGPGSYDRRAAEAAAREAAGIEPCSERCGAYSPAGFRQKHGGRSSWACPSCSAAKSRAFRAQALAEAWDSVPERYRSDEGLRFGPKSLEVLSEPVTATRGMVLHGPSGAGKTVLACAYLTRWLTRAEEADDMIARPGSARFVSAYRLARARAEHRLGGGEAPLVKSALGASTLILDDLGSEPDVRDSAVGEVLYERHSEGKRTIVTTSYPGPQDAALRYGDGIARRIWQGSKILGLPKRSGA